MTEPTEMETRVSEAIMMAMAALNLRDKHMDPHEFCIAVARASISVMSEPTVDMVTIGCDSAPMDDSGYIYPPLAYKRMIAAALSKVVQ